MSTYLGDFRAGQTVDCKFQTLNTSAVPTTLAGTPAVSVYKGNSTSASTAGVTLSVDFNSLTGLNHVRITTASDGTFYAEGAEFQVVITAGTVNSVSVVGQVVAAFSLNNRSALTPVTSGRSAIVNSDGMVQADMREILGTAVSTPATAGILDINIKNVGGAALSTSTAQLGVNVVSQANIDFGALQKASLNAATPASVVGAVGSVTGDVGGDVVGSVGSVVGNVGGDVEGSVASVATGVGLTGDFSSTMKSTLATAIGTAQTGDSYARIGVAGVGLTNLGDTRIAHLDADVSSRLAPAGTLATVTTCTNLTNAPTAGDLTSTMKASVTSAVPSASAVAAATAGYQGAESYAANTDVPTVLQLLFMIYAALAQFSVSGETITATKLDGSTTAMTFTTNSATAPTSRVRAT